MEEPLFGERKQSTKLLIWAAVGIVIIFAGLTVTVAIINGFRVNKYHFALAAAVVINLAGLALLFKWWNAGDLDPKFNYLVIYFAFAFVCLCVACQFYIWAKKPFVPPPLACGPDNMGLYVLATGMCFNNVSNQCYNPNSQCVCANFDFGSGTYGCYNCTSCANKARNTQERFDYNYWPEDFSAQLEVPVRAQAPAA